MIQQKNVFQTLFIPVLSGQYFFCQYPDLISIMQHSILLSIYLTWVSGRSAGIFTIICMKLKFPGEVEWVMSDTAERELQQCFFIYSKQICCNSCYHLLYYLHTVANLSLLNQTGAQLSAFSRWRVFVGCNINILNFNGGLPKSPPKPGPELIITPHWFGWMYLYIHALIPL